uniref:Uncharacterized protein n=1 Tax=Oryza meridionalis TaxID=40149 RepID=A0A0E0ETI6_9ORYZ
MVIEFEIMKFAYLGSRRVQFLFELSKPDPAGLQLLDAQQRKVGAAGGGDPVSCSLSPTPPWLLLLAADGGGDDQVTSPSWFPQLLGTALN